MALTHTVVFQSTPSARRATFDDELEARLVKISIHALREEGDGFEVACGLVGFISIHALREEGDPLRLEINTRPPNFNPRPPRGGRLAFWIRSIYTEEFQSTPSARRATC